MIFLGDCRYDPNSGMLSDSKGRLLPLRRKSAQVLARLAASPGRLISKDALMSEVWAGVTVTEESLSQCIRDIRKAVGDETRQIIQTVPGRGFMLAQAAVQAPDTKPQTRSPVVGVNDLVVRSGGETAQALGDTIRQEIVTAIARRSGIRVSSGSSGDEHDYDIRGTISARGNGLDVFMEIDERGGRGTFFAETFSLTDQNPDAFVARVAQKVTNVQRVSAIAHLGKRLLSEPDETLDLQQLVQKAAYHYARLTEHDTAAARVILQHATTRFPDSPMARAMLAATSVHLYPLVAIDRSAGRVSQAMALADEAVVAGPQVDFALRTRGNLRFWLHEDIDGAIADCNRALALTPNYQLAHLTLVQIDLFSGAIDAARHRFADQIEVDIALPQYHYFQTILALFALDQGDITAARHHAIEAHDFATWSDWGILVLQCVFGSDIKTLPDTLQKRIATSRLPATHFCDLPARDKSYLQHLAERASKALT